MDKTVMSERKKQDSILSPFFFLHASFFIFLALCLCACDTHGSQTGSYKSFEYKLRGTWVSQDKSVYSGTVQIDSVTITITGYEESQRKDTDPWDHLPFRGFPKSAPLKGYSEDGKLFIGDNAQNSVPYNLETGADKQKDKFLRFNFGGRDEVVKWDENSQWQ